MGLFAAFAWVIVGIVYVIYRILKDEPEGCLTGVVVLLGLTPFGMMLYGGAVAEEDGEIWFWSGLILAIIGLTCFIVWQLFKSHKTNNKRQNTEFIKWLKAEHNLPKSFINEIGNDTYPIKTYIVWVREYGSPEQKVVLSKLNNDRWFSHKMEGYKISEFDAMNVFTKWSETSSYEWELLALEAYGVSDFPQNFYTELYSDIKEKTMSMSGAVAQALCLPESYVISPWYFNWCSEDQGDVLSGIWFLAEHSDEARQYPFWSRYVQLLSIDGREYSPKEFLNIEDDTKGRTILNKMIKGYCSILGFEYRDTCFANMSLYDLKYAAKCFIFSILKTENLIEVSEEQINEYCSEWEHIKAISDPDCPHNLICKYKVQINR